MGKSVFTPLFYAHLYKQLPIKKINIQILITQFTFVD